MTETTKKNSIFLLSITTEKEGYEKGGYKQGRIYFLD